MEPKEKKAKATRQETLRYGMPTIEETIPCKKTTCPKGHTLTNVGKYIVREELITIPHQTYRQIDEWARDDTILSEATLTGWFKQLAKYLRPVWDLIHVHLLQLHFLKGEEKPYQVICEPGREAAQKSYIWVMRSTHQCREPAVYYHYAPTRSGEVAKEICAGFDGIVQIDGYSGYNKLASDMTPADCWTPVRRKFFDAFKGVLDHQTILIPLGYIDRMFYLER